MSFSTSGLPAWIQLVLFSKARLQCKVDSIVLAPSSWTSSIPTPAAMAQANPLAPLTFGLTMLALVYRSLAALKEVMKCSVRKVNYISLLSFIPKFKFLHHQCFFHQHNPVISTSKEWSKTVITSSYLRFHKTFANVCSPPKGCYNPQQPLPNMGKYQLLRLFFK